jgi:hypothetical protein
MNSAAKPADDQRVAIRYPVFEGLGAPRRALALGRCEVLDGDRQALQQPPIIATQYGGLDFRRQCHCLVAKRKSKAAQRRIDFLDPRQAILHDLDWGDIPSAYPRRRFGRGCVSKFQISHALPFPFEPGREGLALICCCFQGLVFPSEPSHGPLAMPRHHDAPSRQSKDNTSP